MGSDARSTARLAPDTSGRGQTHGLAGLIDVLDRADGAVATRRAPARRPSAHRPAGARSGAVRTVPLRSVQPAPMARPTAAPRAYVVPEPERIPVTRLSDLVRRAAMWGAGPRGEYLAWRTGSHTVPARAAQPRPAAPVTPRPRATRAARVRALARRMALWGSGPGGKYLAWGGPDLPDPHLANQRRVVDPPVVLRELPSTPSIEPAAPSPAAALLPRGPASSAGPRGMPPVPRGAVAVPGVRPSGPPERSQAPGRPSAARSSPSAAGAARARGDPPSSPARGSPPVLRRARSPNSTWSSFP
jgi:hypothetical protein